MRMLFLLSALVASVRPRIRDDYHGLIYLMEAIDFILKNNAEMLENVPNRNKRRSKGSRRGRNRGDDRFADDDNDLVAYCLDDHEVDLANEVLKVLFNLTCNVDRSNLDEVGGFSCFRWPLSFSFINLSCNYPRTFCLT